MVALGLVLILVGALAVVAALFTAHGSVELIGLDIAGLTMFFVGLAAGVCLMLGWTFTKWGTKRSLKNRRDNKKMDELSAKLDRREEERRDEARGEDRGDTGDPGRTY